MPSLYSEFPLKAFELRQRNNPLNLGSYADMMDGLSAPAINLRQVFDENRGGTHAVRLTNTLGFIPGAQAI